MHAEILGSFSPFLHWYRIRSTRMDFFCVFEVTPILCTLGIILYWTSNVPVSIKMNSWGCLSLPKACHLAHILVYMNAIKWMSLSSSKRLWCLECQVMSPRTLYIVYKKVVCCPRRTALFGATRNDRQKVFDEMSSVTIATQRTESNIKQQRNGCHPLSSWNGKYVLLSFLETLAANLENNSSRMTSPKN